MLSKTLLEVALKACHQYVAKEILVGKLMEEGAPKIIAMAVMQDSLMMMAFVGEMANSGLIPRDVVEKALTAATCPEDIQLMVLRTYDDALEAYRAAVKSEGIDPDSGAKFARPTEDSLAKMLKLFDASVPTILAMPRRSNGGTMSATEAHGLAEMRVAQGGAPVEKKDWN